MKLFKKFASVLTICFLLVLAVSCSLEHTHKYGEWTLTKEPTMETEGSAERECTCGEKEIAVVPTLATTEVWTARTTEPTCSKEGSIEYTSVYGKVTITTNKVDHEYGAWTITKEPTAEATGSAERTCKYGEKDTVTLPALTNTEVWTVAETIESTCEVAGSVKYTSVYGEVTVTLALASHEYGAWTITKEPTMTEEGSAERTCKYGEKDTVTLPALTNAEVWTEVSKTESTCEVAGSAKYTSVYGEVTVTLALADHEYGAWTITKEPTMTEEGSAERTCKYGEKDTVTLPALTNTEVWTAVEVVKADYNKGGQTEYTSEYGKVTINVAKLVAPYDGKTYYTVYFDSRASEGKYFVRELDVQTSYLAAVTFDMGGYTKDEQFPFRYPTQIEMVNPTTGEILFKLRDDEGHSEEYTGYVDMATGVMVIMDVWSTSRAPFIAFPSETEITTVNATASSWEKAIVVKYVNGDVEGTLYITDKETFFNVTIENAEGTAIEAKSAYASSSVYIKDANGTLIGHFVNNGEELVVSDGLEGTYTAEEGTLVVTGYGKLTLNGVEGTYTIATGENYTLDVYAAGAYYEVTLNEETYTAVKPMVEITFDTNGVSEATPVSANKNVAYELPVLTDEGYVFKGWFYDAECTEAVEDTFVPTVNVTLYAKWSVKVLINLVGVPEGDSTEILLGEGDLIGAFLPKYGTELSIMKKFTGWYIDETFETALDESATVSADYSGFTLYAKWENLPDYYGTYYGTEIWNYGAGNRASYTLTIDENGVMTSDMSQLRTGIITSYNPETQVIKWKDSETSTTEKTFYFDKETKTIAGIYNDNNIGTDYYILSPVLEGTKGVVYKAYGLKSPKTPSDTAISDVYAQFVEITKGTMYFLYNNHIYTNATFEDTAGTTITTVAELLTLKTVIVKVNGEQLLALGTTEINFNGNGSKTKLLDTYYGTYTNGEETVVLDGVGGITYGTKKGTYELSGDTFDVYLSSKTEYYVLTLSGESFTIEKPMVTYHFVTGEGHPEVADIDYNMNIEVKNLPVVTDEGYVFKGWYTSDSYTTAVTSIIPTQDTTLYAKWNANVTVTLYNGSEVVESVKLETGNRYTPKTVSLTDGRVVVGYYLDPEFETEFDSSAEITASTNVYIKAMSIGPEGVISAVSNGGTEKIKRDKIYSWDVVVDENGLLKLTSTNVKISSSESQFVVTFGKESIVSFNYNVESEGGNYDNLYIMIKSNGNTSYTELAHFGGYTNSVGVSGTYLVKVSAGDTLAFVYSKDSSSDKGTDTAIISNLQFTDGYPESKLTYVYNDGTTANTEATIEFGGELTAEQLAAPANVRDENVYKFDKWYLDAEFTTPATVGYAVTVENTTLYARWKEKVSISFVVPEGATSVDTVEVWQNETVTATTTKELYIFRGWYLDAEFTGEAVDLEAGFDESVTLYAKFDEIPAGLCFEKAQELTVDFTNNIVTVDSFTTTEDFQVYYFKLVASVSGKYNITLDSYTKVGGKVSYASPKYVIFASDMTTVVKSSSSLNSSKSWTTLEAGTYYIAVHMYADPSTTISSGSTCWGTLKKLTVETYAHDEVSEAVEYTLGSSITLDSSVISCNSEDYILYFTASEAKIYQFAITTTAWASISIYSNSALTTKVTSANVTSTGVLTVDVKVGTTYYIVVGNNWKVGHTNSLTIESSEFAIRDSFATKVFSGDHTFRCGGNNWTATTTFTFDNVGGVKVSSFSSDHDDYDYGCYDNYLPSFMGDYTYTLEGTTLTMTSSTSSEKQMVFTVDSADAPTTITLVSTTVSSSSQGYFAPGTSFKLK